MSFSTEIKKILCKCEYMCPGCRRAELAGFFMFSGRLTDEQIRCRTAVSEVSLRAVNGIKEEFGIDVKNVNASQLQMIRSQLLCDIFLYDCCKIAYIRGAFLGSGSVNDPEKEYHLEFDAKNENEAEKLTDVLSEYGFRPKTTKRKGKAVVYIKESSQIADLIGHISGGRAGLEILSVQVEKELKSSTQRRVNCDSANLNKLAMASSKHITAIKKIKKARKWSTMPEVLREIGDLRLKYPDVSIEALGKMTSQRIGKSGVNHRLNRIMEYADALE